MTIIYIHTGSLSYDNGAIKPLQQFIELSDMLDAFRHHGEHYNDDYIEFDGDKLEIALEMIHDAKLVHWVVGRHQFRQWQYP